MATIKSHTKKAQGKPPTKPSSQEVMERRIAAGLKKRRESLSLTTAELADQSHVSRAMISKIERLEVSPTAALLGRLCNGLGITLSSLIASAENSVDPPIARTEDQPVWRDPDTGLLRTMVSPLNTGSRTEIVHVELPTGAEVKYGEMREPHYDQHVVVQSGRLTMAFGDDSYELSPGDCMRSRFDVAHTFANKGRGPCKYLVVIVR